MKPVPTLQDHFTAAHNLAVTVRRLLDGRKVTRGDVRAVLEAFEQIDRQTLGQTELDMEGA